MNNVSLIGTIYKVPVFSHNCNGEDFYSSVLITKRLSGVQDKIPLLISEYLLSEYTCPDVVVEVIGELRSFNLKEEKGTRVLLNVFVNSIKISEYADEDVIEVDGYLCKNPSYRLTPKGKEITDLLIAVNRSYGKTDYIPCVAWGKNARESKNYCQGDFVCISGRIQSREYIKGCETKTTHEVSVHNIERVV